MKRIVHISLNEKFIDQANVFFEEAFDQQNQFYIVVYDSSNDKLNYAEYRDNVTLVTIDEMLNIIQEKTFQPDVVIFHCLDKLFYRYVLALRKDIPIVWIIFGYEVYSDPKLFQQKKLFFPKTYKYYKIAKKQSRPKFNLKQNIYFRYIYRLWKKKLYLNDRELEIERDKAKKEVINRINYLGAYFDEEYQRMIDILKTDHLKPFHFWYYPIGKKSIEEITFTKEDNIIIGNSATLVCNHLDIIEKLKELKLFRQSDNYIVPLSYGVKDQYSLKIKQTLSDVGSYVTYLEDFMAMDEYNKILSSAKIAIIASRRQHAIGNTIQLILSGTRVFLSEDNPFFHFLKKNRIYVSSFEHDLKVENFSALSLDQMTHNRKTLQQILDKDTQLKILRDQIDIITSKNREIKNK